MKKHKIVNVVFAIILILAVPVCALLNTAGIIENESALALGFFFGTYVVAPVVAIRLAFKD